MRLSGQVALVTGGGRGIGRAIALAFAREGAHVGLVARTRGELEEVARDIRNMGRQAAVAVADLANEQEAIRAHRIVVQELGAIDILVNNAGISRTALVTELSVADFDAIYRVNVRAVFVMCRQVLPAMIQKGRGVIINISSKGGLVGFARYSAYCASKFAVVGFTQSLAAEVARSGVRVNCICPGEVDTRLNRMNHPGIVNTSDWMSPEEVAEVAVFLASDQSRAVHGASIEVYGLSYMPT